MYTWILQNIAWCVWWIILRDQTSNQLIMSLTLSVENWVSNLKFQTLRIETWVTVNVLLSSILCYIDSINRSTIHWLKTKSKISFLNSFLYWCLWNHKNDLFFNTDDLPLRGFIGHLEEGSFLPHTHKVFLWAHLNFNIAYNGDQVMKIIMTGLEKTKSNSSLSCGQAALTFCVAGATFFVVNGLVRGWIMYWSHWASKL